MNEKQLDVFGMKLPTGFQLIGQVVRTSCATLLQLETETESTCGFGSGKCVQIGACPPPFSVSAAGPVGVPLPSALTKPFPLTRQGLPDYTKWLTHYSTKTQDNPAEPITCRSYARYPPDGEASLCVPARVRRVQRSRLCVFSQGRTNGEPLRWIQRENHRHVHLQLLG